MIAAWLLVAAFIWGDNPMAVESRVAVAVAAAIDPDGNWEEGIAAAVAGSPAAVPAEILVRGVNAAVVAEAEAADTTEAAAIREAGEVAILEAVAAAEAVIDEEAASGTAAAIQKAAEERKDKPGPLLPYARIIAIEVKAATKVTSDDWNKLKRLRKMIGDQFAQGIVFYTGSWSRSAGDQIYIRPIESLWQP